MGIDISTALPAVDIDTAKEHLRVDFPDDDGLIESLVLSATQLAEHEIQHAIITRDGSEGYCTDPADVPAGIRQWILVHVAHWYEHRQSASQGALSPVPFVDSLLDPFRTWS